MGGGGAGAACRRRRGSRSRLVLSQPDRPAGRGRSRPRRRRRRARRALGHPELAAARAARRRAAAPAARPSSARGGRRLRRARAALAAGRAAVRQPAPLGAAALARGRADRARADGRREPSSPPAAMLLVEALDAGPVAALERFALAPDETAGDVYQRALELGPPRSGRRAGRRRGRRLATVPQVGEPTYAAKITAARPRARPGSGRRASCTTACARSRRTSARGSPSTARPHTIWRLAPRARRPAARARDARRRRRRRCSAAPTARSSSSSSSRPVAAACPRPTGCGACAARCPSRRARERRPHPRAARPPPCSTRAPTPTARSTARRRGPSSTRASAPSRRSSRSARCSAGARSMRRSRSSPSARPVRGSSAAAHVLQLGVFQILFAGRFPPHAAVSETVELARRVIGPRATGLANAVLRRIAAEGPAWYAALPEDTPEEAALRHSLPDWIAELWFDAYGARACARPVRAANVPGALRARPNPLRDGQGEVELAADGRAACSARRRDDGRPARRRPARRRGLGASTSGGPSSRSRPSSSLVAERVGAEPGDARARPLRGAGRQDGRARGRRARTSRPSSATRRAPRRSRTTLRGSASTREVVAADGRAYRGRAVRRDPRRRALQRPRRPGGRARLALAPHARGRRGARSAAGRARRARARPARAREGARYAVCTLHPTRTRACPRAAGLMPERAAHLARTRGRRLLRRDAPPTCGPHKLRTCAGLRPARAAVDPRRPTSARSAARSSSCSTRVRARSTST